jgi:hypothetical protein
LPAGSHKAGSAAATAEVNKTQKYDDIISGVDFVPVAIETSGVWGKQGFDLVNEIGRRIAGTSGATAGGGSGGGATSHGAPIRTRTSGGGGDDGHRGHDD